ncbi:phosphatidic acid phosphatase type 2/haloperoxidase [Auriculariales sp. MPI-PUGE-AT-0066]|nr:phosphatidic acid phosphatase type 2/haloperoxidase [Auriculariales sp. MPI-PUGE-AT-0066]
MDSRPGSPPAVSARARANFYGLTRERSGEDDKSEFTLVEDISPELVDSVPNARPGNHPHDVYEAAMASWRFALRTFVMTHLQWESEFIGGMQERVRSPWLDDYFVYTSSLGTHTFFIIFLPAFFFFGFAEHGRGLLFMLCIGVYVSSVIKDLLCAPRPFAPPVTRLTIGNHHLEYGFPSTHSTNSVSLALYCHSILYAAYMTQEVSGSSYLFGVVVLLWYTFSIVYGRLYTGMHSMTDCLVGSTLGASIWWLHMSYGQAVDNWVVSSGWEVPVILISISIAVINQHPQPIDDCPCFEDAIACVAVVAGVMVSRWYTVRIGIDASYFTIRTPGWQKENWEEKLLWVCLSAVKLIGGLLAIAVWRIVAKLAMHSILPPFFRALARITSLPNRRFYIPATDYSRVPTEKTLQPIPSVIDLPSTLHAHSVGNLGLPRDAIGNTHLKQRKNAKGSGGHGTPPSRDDVEEFTAAADAEPMKHYDADVVTKAIVYSGIGIIATQITPIVFELVGVGLN